MTSFALPKEKKVKMAKLYQHVIDSGSDTDFTATIAGQIAGTLHREEGISTTLKERLKSFTIFDGVK